MVTERDDKKQISKIIFPRYHQLDATRRILAAVLAEGAGEKYLIQHSAGSGKTNSIAWTFAAGHRFRLIVAGSNHPRYEVNPDSAGTHTLHTGGPHPSRILLSVEEP